MKVLLIFVLLFIPLNLAAMDREPQEVETDRQARKLLNSQGCKACHTLEGAGGNNAPELLPAGHRLTAETIRQQLVNPEQRHGDGRTPDFHHLHNDEIDVLVRFLTRPEAQATPDKTPAPQREDLNPENGS